jgi:hypothetical protein
VIARTCAARTCAARTCARGADLGDANLGGADLGGAYLRGADLGDADLRGAYLRGAYLRGANLGGANLGGTCLQVLPSPHGWAMEQGCLLRAVGTRILCLGSRTQNQPHMGGEDYELGRLYIAPYFSHDPTTACHPGLYVAGGPDEEDMLVAFWLDEALIVGKCRVPRFYTLAAREGFNGLTAEDMEASPSDG